ncbi:MAG: hypothetical protein AAGJ80_17505, partial [Cyanobacteria bacterium J06553_1]
PSFDLPYSFFSLSSILSVLSPSLFPLLPSSPLISLFLAFSPSPTLFLALSLSYISLFRDFSP